MERKRKMRSWQLFTGHLNSEIGGVGNHTFVNL